MLEKKHESRSQWLSSGILNVHDFQQDIRTQLLSGKKISTLFDAEFLKVV